MNRLCLQTLGSARASELSRGGAWTQKNINKFEVVIVIGGIPTTFINCQVLTR